MDGAPVPRPKLRMPTQIGSRIRTATTNFKIDTTPRLLVLAALVGLGAGLGAVVLIEAVDFVSEQAGRISGDSGSSLWIFALLPGGLWLAWFLTYRFAAEAAGHGIPQIIGSIVARSGKIRLRVAPIKTIATALTLGVGGSAGREGPIAHIGAAIGSRLGRRLKLNESMVRSLIGAGAAAGISTTFNAPIAGMLFAMEVILGSFSGAHMSAIVVASVIGAVVSRGIVGEELAFTAQAYPVSSPWELLLYALLGVAAAAAGYLFLKQLAFWETKPDKMNRWTRPLIIGLGIAAVGYFRPEVLGSGQAFINDLLRDDLKSGLGSASRFGSDQGSGKRGDLRSERFRWHLYAEPVPWRSTRIWPRRLGCPVLVDFDDSPRRLRTGWYGSGVRGGGPSSAVRHPDRVRSDRRLRTRVAAHAGDAAGHGPW